MSRSSARVLSALIVLALATGQLVRFWPTDAALVTALLGAATLLTVAGLESGWHRRAEFHRDALRLLAVSILAGSLPAVAVAVVLGARTPAGLGFLSVAVVPVAAGLPAYASAVGARAERITLFCLYAYVIALPVTPVLLAWLFPATDLRLNMVATVLGALVAPTVLGLLFGRRVRAVPPRLRRTLAIACLLFVMASLSAAIEPSRLAATAGSSLAVVVVLAVLRAPLSGALGMLLVRSWATPRDSLDAVLAGGYRNCALAGTAALTAGMPAAAVVPVLGLVSEALLLVSLPLLVLDRSHDT